MRGCAYSPLYRIYAVHDELGVCKSRSLFEAAQVEIENGKQSNTFFF